MARRPPDQSNRQPRRLDEATQSLRAVAVCHLIVDHGGQVTLAALRDGIRHHPESTLDIGGYKRAFAGDLLAGRLELDGSGDDAIVRVADRSRWKR